jgi:hypothetical protein
VTLVTSPAASNTPIEWGKMKLRFKPRPRRRRLLLLAALTAAIAAVAASTTTVSPAQAAFPTLQVWLTTADGSTSSWT